MKRATAEEIERRATRRPLIRYSQTARTGSVLVYHGGRPIAELYKDGAFGWGASASEGSPPEWAEAIGGLFCAGYSRSEVLDLVVETYTRMWREGTIA